MSEQNADLPQTPEQPAEEQPLTMVQIGATQAVALDRIANALEHLVALQVQNATPPSVLHDGTLPLDAEESEEESSG